MIKFVRIIKHEMGLAIPHDTVLDLLRQLKAAHIDAQPLPFTPRLHREKNIISYAQFESICHFAQAVITGRRIACSFIVLDFAVPSGPCGEPDPFGSNHRQFAP